MGDKKILIGGGIVIGLVILRSWTSNQPVTKPLEGGLIAILLLSLLAAFGEKQALLAGNLAMLVAITAIFSSLPAVLKQLGV